MLPTILLPGPPRSLKLGLLIPCPIDTTLSLVPWSVIHLRARLVGASMLLNHSSLLINSRMSLLVMVSAVTLDIIPLVIQLSVVLSDLINPSQAQVFS